MNVKKTPLKLLELKKVQINHITDFLNGINELELLLKNYIQGIKDEKEIGNEYAFDIQSMAFVRKSEPNDISPKDELKKY